MSWWRQYLKAYRDPHRGLQLLCVVGRFHEKISVLRVPMPIPHLNARSQHVQRIWSLVWKMIAHLLMVGRIWQQKKDFIVVREFLTVPLMACALPLIKRRKKLWFLVHHNINNAITGGFERRCLLVLQMLGFQFIVFEDGKAWANATRSSGDLKNVRSLPFPMPIWASIRPARPAQTTGPVVIGFVGQFRVEKSPEWAINIVRDLATRIEQIRPVKLLVATPDESFRKRWGASATVIDTTSHNDYLAALLSCDVLVVPYSRESYFYRCSGILAEAVACGCVVVAPSFPLICSQVMHPWPVGVTYDSESDFIIAVDNAINMVGSASYSEARTKHLRYRAREGIKEAMQKIVTDGT